MCCTCCRESLGGRYVVCGGGIDGDMLWNGIEDGYVLWEENKV